jgi:hypothetical protein
VGWRLHPLDELKEGQASETSDRFLDYLPETIFVQFDNVSWQLKGLPVGVLPIWPESHNWTLNKETKSEVERRGFRLIPDFASTAFMMQGASLLAALVDCGDVDAPGIIHSMVNAYVILSRVKNASGLALLRAFSPELFSGGVAPGCPWCVRYGSFYVFPTCFPLLVNGSIYICLIELGYMRRHGPKIVPLLSVALKGSYSVS